MRIVIGYIAVAVVATSAAAYALTPILDGVSAAMKFLALTLG